MKNGVNIYDFDGTIYDGDSSIDFYLFCLKRNFKILLCLPLQFFSFILFKLGIIDRKEFKEKFFCFLKFVKDLNELVTLFWKDKFSKIKPFYLKKKHNNDIIISASPEFLIKSIGEKLKVKDVIATKMNSDGTIVGENCHGEEKVKRFKDKYNNIEVKNVYTDSLADIPILELSKNRFIIDKNNISKYDDSQKNKFGKVFENKYFKKISDICFLVSSIFTSLLFCGNYELKYIKYLIILSFIFGIILRIKVIKRLEFARLDKKIFLFSCLFSLYGVGLLYRYTGNNVITYISNILTKLNINLSSSIITFIICILSLYFIIEVIYYLCCSIFPFCKEEYYKLERSDKLFLIVLVSCYFCISSVLYFKTNIFYRPVYHQQLFIPYDVIYTSDSGSLTDLNVYMNVSAVENDIRQPLFGLFSIPFAVLSEFISSFFGFLPNFRYVIFSTIQSMLLGIAIILISRMLGLKNYEKKLFIAMMISTFSFILFSFVYEQYIIALFYLIIAIYVGFCKRKEVNYYYIGAVGTLLTSGVIFPLTSKFDGLKKWILNIAKCFFTFVACMIFSGQILMIFTIDAKIKYLMRFSGNSLSFTDKLLQFIYFIKSIFIAPKSFVLENNYFYSYRIISVDFISRLGILLLLICFVSFILNRKNKFAKISFLWIIFSFLVLCLFGWGTQENGLILYSLYFFWAYVSLICLFINKVFRNKYVKIFIYFIIIFIMLYFNLFEFIKIVQFGIYHYYN